MAGLRDAIEPEVPSPGGPRTGHTRAACAGRLLTATVPAAVTSFRFDMYSGRAGNHGHAR